VNGRSYRKSGMDSLGKTGIMENWKNGEWGEFVWFSCSKENCQKILNTKPYIFNTTQTQNTNNWIPACAGMTTGETSNS